MLLYAIYCAVYVEDILLDLTVKNKKLVYGANTVTQLTLTIKLSINDNNIVSIVGVHSYQNLVL